MKGSLPFFKKISLDVIRLKKVVDILPKIVYNLDRKRKGEKK